MPADGFSHLEFEALGTSCHLFAVAPVPGRLPDAAAWVHGMHGRLSRFEPDSELSRLNAAAGIWQPVSAELEELLRESLRAHDVSHGLVNAGVLGSMLAIGYSRPFREGPTDLMAAAAGPLPALPAVLEVAPGRARLEPGWGVDLGGIAKGWMADRLCRRLGPNCLVNLGGDLYAQGGGPAGEGWPIALGGATVLLRDQGAATSGTRRRRWPGAPGEPDLHHLIDPRTGRPALSDLSTVSVVAVTALRAEIAAKTALLLGAARAPAYLTGETLGWWME